MQVLPRARVGLFLPSMALVMGGNRLRRRSPLEQLCRVLGEVGGVINVGRRSSLLINDDKLFGAFLMRYQLVKVFY